MEKLSFETYPVKLMTKRGFVTSRFPRMHLNKILRIFKRVSSKASIPNQRDSKVFSLSSGGLPVQFLHIFWPWNAVWNHAKNVYWGNLRAQSKWFSIVVLTTDTDVIWSIPEKGVDRSGLHIVTIFIIFWHLIKHSEWIVVHQYRNWQNQLTQEI